MRITIVLCLFIAALVSGCATASKSYTSDGKEGYIVTCSGTLLNWGMCYKKAGKLCGTQGYEVLEKNEDKGAMLSANQQFGLNAGTVINRNLIIKCGTK